MGRIFDNFLFSLPTPLSVRSYQSSPTSLRDDLFDSNADTLMKSENAIGVAMNDDNFVEGEKGQSGQSLKVDLRRHGQSRDEGGSGSWTNLDENFERLKVGAFGFE